MSYWKISGHEEEENANGAKVEDEKIGKPWEVKILVDGMLKNVAKLLKIMGYNVDVFEREKIKDFFSSGDVFITARRNLPHHIKESLKNIPVIFVKEDEPPEYTCAKIVNLFGWDEDMYLSKCLLCGDFLQKPKQEDIPSEILNMKIPYDTITYCVRCRKYFWEGTHHIRMERKVKSVLLISKIDFREIPPEEIPKSDFFDELLRIYMQAYEGMEEYGEETDKDAIRYIRWLSRHSTFFLVAFLENRPIGFVSACANWWSWGGNEEVGEIHEICVEKDKWGFGIGSVLLFLALEHLRNKGMKKFGLWVGDKNERAIRFYSKFGFHIIGKFFKIWIRMEKEERS